MFNLHPQLETDTFPVCDLELCAARLMNDRRFPWIILVPRRDAVTEVQQLPRIDQERLIHESSLAAHVLGELCEVDKINLAALGNLVPQLHWHVVARTRGDAAWPGPVWGYGQRLAYDEEGAAALVKRLRSAFQTPAA